MLKLWSKRMRGTARLIQNFSERSRSNPAQLSLDLTRTFSSSSPTPHDDQLELENKSLFMRPSTLSMRGFGVFKESEKDDLNVLVNNFTSPALARALRERESTLQCVALLAQNGEWQELRALVQPFLKANVERRRVKKDLIDLSKTAGLTRNELVILQRYLLRLPRHIYKAVAKRASVVIPLCNVEGIPSVLFERRSNKVRTHKLQVCFPGGMVDEDVDATIIQTSLREMQEELGIPPQKVEVLGILRCDWSEVASMTGIAVTPVVGFVGDLSGLVLSPNPEEVDELFTVPLRDLLNAEHWDRKELSTPVFKGAPHVIWGLTAYLMDHFLRDVVMKCVHSHEPADDLSNSSD